ncbi:MAG: HDOD domain-containing protein [Treponema sp.]|jgi:putative nucleotidyltransferase with HDIG domain|nr:HDOD domain-containing protein [Treponema sp.]
MAVQKKITPDVAKIKMAIRTGIPLSITTYTLPHEMEIYMSEVLSIFLNELNQSHMVEYLNYCVNELITNAKKANTKRVYFKEKNLDIMNPADYEQGMKTFKEDTLNNIHYYLQLQKEANLYVKFILQVRNNKIKVEIRNNSELTVFEYKRIHDKLSRAQQYSSVDETLNQIIDDTEGAGLGLIIMILMLEKIGLTEENFQSLCENGETITRIILPLNEKTQKDISVLSDEFVKLIDDLPQFPDNIIRINRLLNDPDSRMSDIAMNISADVTLTAELLKTVNSAAFALASPCHSITDAVKLVGLRGIKNLLYSIGTVKTLKSFQNNEKEDLWTHANLVAFYSYNLARNLCADDRHVIEDSYVCGLLHDMGKILFENAHPDVIDKIRKICIAKGISSDIFEKLIAGVNHGEIGAKIAEKWNFPEVIVNVICYHHEPDLAPQEYRKLTSLVYIADLMVHYQDKEVDFYQIDPAILELFNIKTQKQFDTISDRLATVFKRQNQ